MQKLKISYKYSNGVGTVTTMESSPSKKNRHNESTSESPSKGGRSQMPNDKTHSRKRSVTPDSLEPRTGKRLRHQYQPFQSPSLPVFSPPKPIPKQIEDKVIVFFRGEFLALRNETASFFVCQAAQNVYKSSRRFKIRWLNKVDHKEPNVYAPDFYDQTDFECVLTNLRLERVDKNMYRLPKDETERTENILKRALNMENGIEPDLEHMEIDGVDVSKLKDINDLPKLKRKIELKPTQSQPTTKISNSTSKHEQRPEHSTEKKDKKHKKKEMSNNNKKKKMIVSKVKMKSKVPSSSKSQTKKVNGVVKPKPRKESRSESRSPPKKKKVESPQATLKPNSRVTVCNKDPLFETSTTIPFVSVPAHNKMLIRAVLTRDSRFLQSLLNETAIVSSITAKRSIDQPMDALAYALQQDNTKMTQTILNERRKASPRVLPPETFITAKGKPWYNTILLDHHVKDTGSCRVPKEGNAALAKDQIDDLEDCDYVAVALEAGVSLSTIDVFCNNPVGDKTTDDMKNLVYLNIYRALRGGHYKLAGQLVEKADLHDGYGFTNLHREVLTFDKQDLSAYRPEFARVAAFTNKGITPIHCACVNPNPKYVRWLLSVDPQHSLEDTDGRKPIHYAVACEGSGPLEYLLSRGVVLDDVDKEGNSPLHVAAWTGREHNVELLLKKAKQERKTEGGTEYVKDVLCINRMNSEGMTPLHKACRYGRVDVVRVLVKYNVDLEATTCSKLTPLMLACQQGHLEVTKILLQHEAKIETKDKYRRTALMHAIINGHAHVASHLLRVGADPNTADSSGNTLLHYAVAYGWLVSLNLLLDAGANPNLINDAKINALAVGFLRGHYGVVDLLLEQKGLEFNSKDGFAVLLMAAASPLTPGLVEQVRFLLQNSKVDSQVKDTFGNTALHWLSRNTIRRKDGKVTKVCPMAEATSLDVARLLLDHGCDPSVKNTKGKTPLILAIEQGNVGLVRLYLQRCTNLSTEVDERGDNLLHFIVRHSVKSDMAQLISSLKNNTEEPLEEGDVPDTDLWNLKVPVMHSLDSPLRDGEKLEIKAVANTEDGGFGMSLLNGDDLEQSDVGLQVQVTFKDEQDMPAITCRHRSEGNWTEHLEQKLFPLAIEGQADIQITMIVEEGKIRVLFNEGQELEHDKVVASMPVTHLHLDGALKISRLTIHRNKPPKPLPLFLTMEMLREMCQVYNNEGFTPLLLACSQYNSTSVKKEQTNLRAMIKTLVEDCESDVRATVKEKPDSKERAIDGYTCLHFMAECVEPATVNDSVEPSETGLGLLLSYKPVLSSSDACGRTPLIAAILSRCEGAAQVLVEAGADPNQCSRNLPLDGEASPLVLAAKMGLRSVVQVLLKSGVNVTSIDKNSQNTALHYAVSKLDGDTLDTVGQLLEARANVNAANLLGQTPLHMAVIAFTKEPDKQREIVSLIDLLLHRGAKPLARDSQIRIPLHYVFQDGTSEEKKQYVDPISIVSVLVAGMKGQPVDSPDINGQTPLHLASFKGSIVSAVYLAQRMPDLSHKDRSGNTALSLAVSAGHESCAVALVQRGASVLCDVCPLIENQYRTPWTWKGIVSDQKMCKPVLEVVVERKWYHVLHLMLDQLQATGRDCLPAVQAALRCQQLSLAGSLIAQIRDARRLTAGNTLNQNLLHLLAMNSLPTTEPEKQLQLASMLVSNGVPVMSRDEFGAMPLTYAAIRKNYTLCRFFTDQVGADALSRAPADKFGRTPLAAALWCMPSGMWSKPEIEPLRVWCEMLLQRGSSANVLVQYPVVDPFTGTMGVTNNKHHNPPVTYQDPNAVRGKTHQTTPLIHAVCCREYDLVHFLLERGANPNLPDELGRTPLMQAVRLNDITMAKLLLNYKYDYAKDIRTRNTQRRKRPSAQPVISSPGKSERRVSTAGTPENPERRTSASGTPDTPERRTNGTAETTDSSKPECADVDVKDSHDDSVFTKTSSVDIAAQDLEGWTVVHHLISPFPGAGYDNVELLQLLVSGGTPLSQPCRAGKTPLQMAMESRNFRLANFLKETIDKTPGDVVKPPPVPDVVEDGMKQDGANWEYKVDAASVLERADNEASETDVVPVERLAPEIMEEIGEVALDTEQNLPYDALLVKVDVFSSLATCYSYYKMQVIGQKGKPVFVLVSRLGCSPVEGQYQQAQFHTLEEAAREFGKVFRAKTGNSWQELNNFQPVPRKYRLLGKSGSIQRRLNDVSLQLLSEVPPKLPPAVQLLMTELTNVETMKSSCVEAGLDVSVMPFSRLCETTLRTGRHLLLQLRSLVVEKAKLEEDTSTRDKLTDVLEKIVDLSQEFYQVIPKAIPIHKMHPLDTLSDIQNCLDRLEHVFALELVCKLLLGSQLHLQEVNPLDYVYRCLDCKIALTSPDDMDSQHILQYIHNTAKSELTPVVDGIYHVSRPREVEGVYQRGLLNHWLLWYSCPTSSLLHVLHSGLVPSNHQEAFNLYNSGLSFSDMFRATQTGEEGTSQYALVCEVALGSVQEVEADYAGGLKEGHHSLKVPGTYSPDPTYNITLSSGVVIPLGSTVSRQRTNGDIIKQIEDHNRYIVFSATQVCLRYLVRFHYPDDKLQ